MRRKNYIMVILCVAIAIMAIVYAAFTTTLNVNGTINASGTFAVTFQSGYSCTATTKAGTDTPKGTITTTAGTTTATLSVSLYTPGDVVTCTIPVKNTGNLQAKYVSSTISNNLTASTTPIAVSVSSSTGTNTIEANGTSNIVVTVKYNWSLDNQPDTSDLSKAFIITSNYAQAI